MTISYYGCNEYSCGWWKEKKLKVIASLQGKTMSSIVEGLIEQYIEEVKSEIDWSEEITAMMRVSEPAFDEWDNDEDEIFNESKSLLL